MVVHLSKDLERLVQVLDERDQELDARAAAFKTDIEHRLASGPATPTDFPALKRRVHEEVEARKAGHRE